MKIKILNYLLAAFLLISCFDANAQKSKTRAVQNKNYPAAFTINKAEFDNLFTYKNNEVVPEKTNQYLKGSVLLMNTLNGDMRFLKLKLDYFKNGFMLVQVNGIYSTQVFIMTDDKSVFYKGKFEKGNLMMSKCSEDEIVSE